MFILNKNKDVLVNLDNIVSAEIKSYADDSNNKYYYILLLSTTKGYDIGNYKTKEEASEILCNILESITIGLKKYMLD